MILAGFIFLLRTAAGALRRTTLKAPPSTFFGGTLGSLEASARVSVHPQPPGQAPSQLDNGDCGSGSEMSASRNNKQVPQDTLNVGRLDSLTLIGDVIQENDRVPGTNSSSGKGSSHDACLCCRERELRWQLCLVKEKQLRQLLQQVRGGDEGEVEEVEERMGTIFCPDRGQQYIQGGYRQLLLQLYSNDATDPLNSSSSPSPYRGSGFLPCHNFSENSFGGLISSCSSGSYHEPTPYPVLPPCEPRHSCRLHQQTKHKPPPSFLYSLIAFLTFHFILFLHYVYPHIKASIQGFFALEQRLKAREQAIGLLCGTMTWWWQVACRCLGVAGGSRGRERGEEKGERVGGGREKGGVAVGGGTASQVHTERMQGAKKMRGGERDVLTREWVWWGFAEIVAGLCKGFEGGLKVWCETDENADMMW